MAKARRGPALFELLGKEGGTLTIPRIPRWWSRGRRAAEREESPAVHEEAPETGLRFAPDRTSEGDPVFEISGDRIRVSLTSVRAAGAIFVGLAVVAAAYAIGARSGDKAGFRRGYGARAESNPAPADEIAALRSQPPAAHLLAPLGGKTADSANSVALRDAEKPKPAPASSVASASGWVRDLTYVVIQEFPAGAADRAKNAQQFLAQRGVEAEVVGVGTGVHLIAAQGYNHKDAGQKKLAEQLLQKIRAIGGQYYAAGGGYKLEGYYKTLKRDTW